MKIHKLLEKYNLLKTFETEINVEQKIFVNEFNQITEKGCYSPILAKFDIFSSRSKKYIGEVNENNFKIREVYDFENFGVINSAKVKVNYNSDKNVLKIKTKIFGMEIIPFLLIGIIFLFYSLLILIAILEILLMLFSSDIKYIDSSMILGPIILTIFAYYFTYLPYRIGKNNVIEMKNNIEIIYQLIEKKHTTKVKDL